MKKSLLIFSGPSGGHLYPALAFADTFKKRHPESVCNFVFTPKARPFLASRLPDGAKNVFYLQEFPFPSFFSLKALPFLLKLAEGFFQTNKILNRLKPDAIVTFGTFVGFPGVVLGRCQKIPAILHEQNVELGRANRVLIPFASKVAVSFPVTADLLPSAKAVWTGNILRSDLVERASRPPVAGLSKFRILILGGSQGAASLNRLIFETFKRFSREEKQKIAVIHITGVSDFPQYERAYDELGIESRVYSFTDAMAELYSSCDMVISRAGAGTLAELAVFGLSGILIPYPHAASHQLSNARFFAGKNAALILEETLAAPGTLKDNIFSLLNDPGKLKRMRENARRLAKPDAAEKLVEEVERFLREREKTS